jgi:hypothetical protein
MSRRFVLAIAMLGLAGPAAAQPGSPCGCRNLCALMDMMLQKEKLSEIFFQYAETNPNRKWATDSKAMEADVYDKQFIPWLGSADRPWPCGKPTGTGTPAADAVTTDVTDVPPCTTYSMANRKPMHEGDTLANFKASMCPEQADAILAHESHHAAQCNQYKPTGKFYDNTPVFAQSEYEANALHAKKLRESIRSIIDNSSSKCGWAPTERQKKDPTSVPSPKQLQRMREMGEALRKHTPNVDLP